MTELIRQYRTTEDQKQKDNILLSIYAEFEKPVRTWATKSVNVQRVLAGDVEDIMVESFVCFKKAVENYDITSSIKFNTYFWTCLHNWAKNIINHSHYDKREVVHNSDNLSKFETVNDEGDSYNAVLDKYCLQEQEDVLVQFMVDVQRFVSTQEWVCAQLMVEDYSVKEIASIMKTTTYKVTKMQKNIKNNKELQKFLKINPENNK